MTQADVCIARCLPEIVQKAQANDRAQGFKNSLLMVLAEVEESAHDDGISELVLTAFGHAILSVVIVCDTAEQAADIANLAATKLPLHRRAAYERAEDLRVRAGELMFQENRHGQEIELRPHPP